MNLRPQASKPHPTAIQDPNMKSRRTYEDGDPLKNANWGCMRSFGKFGPSYRKKMLIMNVGTLQTRSHFGKPMRGSGCCRVISCMWWPNQVRSCFCYQSPYPKGQYGRTLLGTTIKARASGFGFRSRRRAVE